MIADKIIPAFYVVEIEGSSVNALFNGDFGIEKVVAASASFKTDIAAINAAMICVDSISEMSDGEFIKSIEFNPEFFPTLSPIKSDDEEDILADQAVADAITQQSMESGKIPVVATFRFDPLGDYVESRYSAKSKSATVMAKIAVDPNIYINHKAAEQVMRSELIDRSALSRINIH